MKPQFSFIQFTIAFVAGIILGDACCGFVSAWVWLVLFVLSAGVCFVFRNIPVKGTIAIVCGCLLGCLIISLHEQNSNVSLPQKKVYYEGVVVSKPVETGKAPDTDLSLYETIKLKAKKIRQRLVEGMSSEISDSESLALLAAMSLGDKSLLSNATKDEFSQSGASHILALSGLHMSIIFAVLLLLFSNSFVGRILCIISLWFFVFLFGMPSSSVRAATMLSIYAFGSILHRSKKQNVHTLAQSAFFILLINPLSLWDVGFQMSFVAILSIFIYYKPFFETFNLSFKPLRWLYASVCLSMAAQIGTAPLIVYYFGRFSCYFILTNILVIPCTTAILYFMMLALLLLPIKTLSLFMLNAAAYVVNLMYGMVRWVAQLPGSSIDNIHISTVQLIALYAFILALTILIPYYRKVRALRNLRNDT